MKHLVRRAVVAAALACSLAGCAGANGLLAAATSAAGGSTGTTPSSTSSMAPSTGTTPTTTTSTSATAKPATTATAKPDADPNSAAACTRTSPAGNPQPGDSTTGDYNNQLLPDGWNAQFTTEAQVSNAIDNLYQNDWPCFQKFYPGASTIYKRKRGIS